MPLKHDKYIVRFLVLVFVALSVLTVLHMTSRFPGQESLVYGVMGSVVAALIVALSRNPFAKGLPARPRRDWAIRVGYSVFPDSMLLLLDVAGEHFEQLGLCIEPVRCDWSSIFEELMARKVDIIIGNYNMYKKFSVNNDLLVDCAHIVQYNGFAILVDKGFAPGLNRIEQDEDKAIRMALNKLKDKTIIASDDTDHKDSFINLLRAYGFKHKEHCRIIDDKSPDEGVRAFLDGKADAYVGGLPQRMYAEGKGKSALLSQDIHQSLPCTEINALIATRKVPNEIIQNFVTAWYKTVNEFYQNQDGYTREIADLLNREIKQSDSTIASSFDKYDIDRIFKERLEVFPRDKDEGRKLVEALSGTTPGAQQSSNVTALMKREPEGTTGP